MPTLRAPNDAPDPVLAGYAAHLGIPVHHPQIPDSDAYPMWNGTALKEPDHFDDWAHEIAHWLLAGPARRRFVNYGWGQDYQYFYMPDDPFTPGDLGLPFAPEPYANADEEVAASVLGFAFLAQLGLNPDWDSYGLVTCIDPFTGEARLDAETGDHVWRLDSTANVPAFRRSLQPHVADFKAWLADA